VTPAARAAHRQLSASAERLADILREVSPTSSALALVAESLECLAREYREQAATCAEHEQADAERLRQWCRHA
jgi:hypothetical protein